MKHFFTFLFLLAIGISMDAQMITVTPLEATESITSSDTKVYIIITNNTSSPVDIHWAKADSIMPTGWGSAVCVNAQCFPPTKIEGDFQIEANAKDTIELHTFSGADGVLSIVQLALTPNNTDTEKVSGTYTFTKALGNEDGLVAEEISFFPNPTTANIHIQNGDLVAGIQIFNMLGVQVLNATNQSIIDVSNLSNGLYLIRFFDKKGQVLATERLKKI